MKDTGLSWQLNQGVKLDRCFRLKAPGDMPILCRITRWKAGSEEYPIIPLIVLILALEFWNSCAAFISRMEVIR